MNWWEQNSGYNKKKTYSSNNRSREAGDDMGETVNKNSKVLPALFTALFLALTEAGKDAGDSLGTVIEWRWPHE